uniref:Uncharacterized protein n=1 Tax=Ananas comosus var. bracteatus TaxID=296719 RepID=A0A6V7PLH9_ANACO|nr:unnamed protein product [Ananas comosus var. bracteatus]
MLRAHRARGRAPSLRVVVPYSKDYFTRRELRQNALLVDIVQLANLGRSPQQTIANAMADRFGGYSTDFIMARHRDHDFAVFLPEWVSAERLEEDGGANAQPPPPPQPGRNDDAVGRNQEPANLSPGVRQADRGDVEMEDLDAGPDANRSESPLIVGGDGGRLTLTNQSCRTLCRTLPVLGRARFRDATNLEYKLANIEWTALVAPSLPAVFTALNTMASEPRAVPCTLGAVPTPSATRRTFPTVTWCTLSEMGTAAACRVGLYHDEIFGVSKIFTCRDYLFTASFLDGVYQYPQEGFGDILKGFGTKEGGTFFNEHLRLKLGLEMFWLFLVSGCVPTLGHLLWYLGRSLG